MNAAGLKIGVVTSIKTCIWTSGLAATKYGFFQLSEMTESVAGLERERDFYFGKLRDIEVLCQENEDQELPVLKSILEILYATEVCIDDNQVC